LFLGEAVAQPGRPRSLLELLARRCARHSGGSHARLRPGHTRRAWFGGTPGGPGTGTPQKLSTGNPEVMAPISWRWAHGLSGRPQSREAEYGYSV